MAWFRVYDDILDDPKVQNLTPQQFKNLVNLWCVAKRCGGEIPPVADVAWRMRIAPRAAKHLVAELQALKFIDVLADGRLVPHNWNGRQFASDTSTERVRKHREHKRETVSGNDDETFQETHQNRDRAETEKNPPVSPPSGDAHVKQPKRRIGTRLPDDWQATDQHRRTARGKGIGYVETEVEIGKFKTYYTVGPGRNKTFSDWDQAWLNWCVNAVQFAGGRPAKVNGQAMAPPRPIAAPSKDTPREALRYPDKPWHHDDNQPDYTAVAAAAGAEDDGPW